MPGPYTPGMRARLFLASALIACSLSARGQSSIPDVSAPQESNGASPTASPDPLQGQGQHLKTLLSIGAQSGIDPGTSFTFQTAKGTIVVNTAEKEVAAPAKPAAPDYALPVLVAALLIFAGTVFLKSRERPAPPAPAKETPSFTIVRSIGEGGMGVVYEAIDLALDRRVAVKKLRDDAQDGIAGIQNLVKEAKTVASLHHPNIVDIYGVTSQGGEYYVVFELIEGRTVHSLLEEHGRFNLKDTRAILDPVCRALEFAHERGIVHRDLKPANVMITTRGQIKVMDFGLARNLHQKGPAASGSPFAPGAAASASDSAMTNTFSGTPGYAAPEANFGLIVPQSDVYALGVMAYRMLGGALPFSTQAGLDASSGGYQPLSQLIKEAPAAIDALIAAALESDPQKRLASPGLFRERLAAL